MTKVSCIIVTYNGMKWIEKCLSTIQENKVDLEILVIDNNSTDNTVEFIKSNFPQVKLFPQKKNLGFAAANNLGYEKAVENGSEFIYLLNQDTISYPDTIFRLIESYNHLGKNIGFISPLHLNDSGTNLDILFDRYIGADSCPSIISDLLLDKKKDIYKIRFVNAASWLLSVKTIREVGGLFSLAFFHYGEDENFVSRLRYFGFTNYLQTNLHIHHCREERKGKKTKDFLKKESLINAQIRLLDVNFPLKKSVFRILKISLSSCFNGDFKTFIKLILILTLKYHQLKTYRNSYIKKNII